MHILAFRQILINPDAFSSASLLLAQGRTYPKRSLCDYYRNLRNVAGHAKWYLR